MIYGNRGAMRFIGAVFLAAGGQLVSFAGDAAETEPPTGASAEAEANQAIEIVVTDVASYSPIGRMIYASAGIKF